MIKPAIAIVAMALSLVACAPSGGATVTLTETETVAPGAETPGTETPGTEEPAAEPTPADTTPSCEDGGVAPGLLDCLDTNKKIVGNPGQSLVIYDPTACSASEGLWVDATGNDGFSLNGQAGEKIGRIDVWNADVQTAEGVGRGTTLKTLLATYPNIKGGGQIFNTKIWWLKDANGYVVFETAKWDYKTFNTAPAQVVYMRILKKGSDPNYTVEASENIAGACSFAP